MSQLSVLIPSRCEMFLDRTVEDVLANRRADTDIIVVLDGAWPEVPLVQHPDVHVVYRPVPIGQRAATNLAARLSSATYVMKLDAHCSLDDGFDAKLIAADEDIGRPDLTQIPALYNLHAFDWVCGNCDARTYQGPTPTVCKACRINGPFSRDVVWSIDGANGKAGRKVYTTSWCFDSDLHFQYFGEFDKRPEAKGDLVPTMSALGACFFMRRERFWELGGLDEAHGSWGAFGTEIACKSWLSGGLHYVNKRTWFAHLFRTQGLDFGFPYEQDAKQVAHARTYSQDLWRNNKWPLAKHPLSWLVERFWPVKGWKQEEKDALDASGRRFDVHTDVPVDVVREPLRGVSKGAIYYSDCRGDAGILEAVREQIRDCQRTRHLEQIVSVTLKPVDLFFDNIVLPLERGYLTMFKQILVGLEAIQADYVFFCEHDVLYHKSHFDFVPPRDDVYYYNEHTYKVDAATGRAVFYHTKQTSGLCASRALLLQHYRERVRRVEAEGFSRRMGFEPGTHNRAERVDDVKAEAWMSAFPNIDIRHGHNLTQSRWSPEQFRDQRHCTGWNEVTDIPGWGDAKTLMDRVCGRQLQEVG